MSYYILIFGNGVPSIYNFCSEEDQRIGFNLDNGAKSAVMTLSLAQNPTADKLYIKVNLIDISVKRTLVSLVARIIDPMGLLAPVFVTAKILVQQLSKHDLSATKIFQNLAAIVGVISEAI
uniref:Uncharacterized protein n=1 Tax=Glossina palpalis gambiensis TaxID=67801 RepID=A0A1B0BZ31_9MUSC